MSFRDLPADWPRRPLTDPRLARDVLDLCVSDVARHQGGLCVLALRRDFSLAQPFFVPGPLPRLERHSMLAGLVSRYAPVPPGGGVVLGVVHPGSAVSDADRAVHQDLIEVCRDTGVRLVSAHLVTTTGTDDLPRTWEAA
ncbi:MAG TPA: hypothetical protein VJ976_01215 [Ornithinimicrobium sp.]|uniref:hypothetical protein n=1 Tax=Ornithinimicrobium sp. TaxID=1977084 RepID=UPI002B489C87|nr:hypothetical protein [Ornithinimicrobium sp.]HKJ10987.1 hypothetical protein [Ornithinimicrobium sp.]